MFLPVFVCLSVCLLVRLLKNACMDLDEMLRSTDVGTWTNWLTFEPDPDYSPDAGTGLLFPISHKRCYAEFCVGKIQRRPIRIDGPPLQRGVVLKWFYSPSHRNTFIGGTCAVPTTLLVAYALEQAACFTVPKDVFMLAPVCFHLYTYVLVARPPRVRYATVAVVGPSSVVCPVAYLKNDANRLIVTTKHYYEVGTADSVAAYRSPPPRTPPWEIFGF